MMRFSQIATADLSRRATSIRTPFCSIEWGVESATLNDIVPPGDGNQVKSQGLDWRTWKPIVNCSRGHLKNG
jgi:hypothetical protein